MFFIEYGLDRVDLNVILFGARITMNDFNKRTTVNNLKNFFCFK